jgi:hypothetical protein
MVRVILHGERQVGGQLVLVGRGRLLQGVVAELPPADKRPPELYWIWCPRLVSATVKDLVTGSGTAFGDRGVHRLKGVPEEWPLYAVEV